MRLMVPETEDEIREMVAERTALRLDMVYLRWHEQSLRRVVE